MPRNAARVRLNAAISVEQREHPSTCCATFAELDGSSSS
jgi:hypothetical protein